ncbi:hypothetical protein [Sediminibacillus massiliensis]|uniref:hypothetical protein n=1 Tax=Sediminibacillus massiliensis TaxID=1926277 RepID=UPI000988319E|nr:hypothetical protein [Sediminibacillus massiliensis]
MKDYFYREISKCFDNVIFRKYGSVTVGLLGNDEDTVMQYVAYDIPYSEYREMDAEEQEGHVKIRKTYDISDVDFNNKMSVLQKINELVRSFEMEVYT